MTLKKQGFYLPEFEHDNCGTYELALKYSKERKAFGTEIGKYLC